MQPDRPDMEPRRQRRVHRTDWLSLLCGLLFIGIGLRYLNAPDANNNVIMFPVLVVGLGFAGLVAIVAKAIRKR